MTPLLKKILGMNWVLLFVMYGLLIFGIFAIQSAARHLHVSDEILRHYGSPGLYYAEQQKTWIYIGSVVYFIVAFIDYRWLRWLALPAYLASIVLMVMAIGSNDDVHRLTVMGVSFQPAQLGISSGIVMIAWLLQDLPKLNRIFDLPFFRLLVIAVVSAVPFLLVMKMGDMGSALVWLPVLVVALLVGGIPFRYLSFLGLLAAGLVPLLYFIVLPLVSERGPQRIDTWLKMMRGQQVDISDEGWAPYNISMAVGKAGWSGVGWNAGIESGSIHAKGMVPKNTAHNDYIFAVIAEEFGFRGTLLLLTAFSLLMIQGLFIAFYSRDIAGRLIASMVVAMIFAHVFESIGMCVLIMPITGIPLPLISYSGTYVVICMMLLGLVQSVWVNRNTQTFPNAANV